MLVGVLSRCAAFVSNDSGAMHLAAAAGVPVTAIFGPTDERVTAPVGDADVLVHPVFCRPCMLRDCPIDHRCMKGITADVVSASVARRLGGARMTPAVFLDRDGTLIEESGYLDRLDRLVFYPFSVDAVRLLNRAGWPVVVISNQSGVGRGLVRDAFVQEAHAAHRQPAG